VPFDYDAFEGEVWKDTIETLLTTKGRKKPLEIEFPLANKPIKVFLKITKGKVIDKSPVFIIKGRRIAEVREIRSFRTNHKGDIWGHPNLTGYIDLGGFLQPNIARNDFKNSPQSKAVFEKLSELEELILLFLKDVNKKSDEKHYKELEDELNKALSKLAKIDHMNFRTELIPGKTSYGSASNEMEKSKINEAEDENASSKKEYFDGEGKYNWEGNAEKQKGIENTKELEKNKPMEPDNPFEDNELKGEEKKKSGFNIEISERDPDIDAENNEPQRSNLVGSTITIYRKHSDFAKRVDKKRSGESIITQRLITYLAGEITVHYKDKFVTRDEQPSYNKKMFSSVVDFIYKFEDTLSGLVGKNLGDII
jgi:hypothetical protein